MVRPARIDRRRQAAVVGIHALPFSKDIGMPERHSGALAVLGALADAGLAVSDVDAMFRYVWEQTTEMEMARILGVPNLRMFGEFDYGGCAGPPTVSAAALAIENDLADVAVVWRSRNRGSGGRPWMTWLQAVGQNQFEWPYHLVRPVDGMALHTRYWMHKYGWGPEVLGRVAVTQRGYANNNPMAIMRGKKITMADYVSARMVADPLRLFEVREVVLRERAGHAHHASARNDLPPRRHQRPLRVRRHLAIAPGRPVTIERVLAEDHPRGEDEPLAAHEKE